MIKSSIIYVLSVALAFLTGLVLPFIAAITAANKN